MPMPTLLHQFQTARRRSVPLISLTTADPAGTLDWLAAAVQGAPLLRWDSVQGLVGVTPEAQAALAGFVVSPLDLNELAEQAQQVLANVDPQALRQSDSLRSYVEKGVRQIQAHVDAAIIPRPIRQIRFDGEDDRG